MPLPKPTAPAGVVPFIKLKEGQNRLRILTEPIEEYTHFLQDEKKSVPCTGNASGCEYCNAGVRASHDYFFLAISRNEQVEKGSVNDPAPPEAKLVRLPPTLYGQYFDLSQNDDWKFDSVPGYDIVINRTGTDLNTRYSITPSAPRELSEADKKAMSEARPLRDMVDEAIGKNAAGKTVSQSSGDVDLDDVSSIPF